MSWIGAQGPAGPPGLYVDVDFRALELDAHARACRRASEIRWVPIHPATTFWRVYRGQRQLGHVALAANGSAWQASHIEPGSGRRLVQPCATLREAAEFALYGPRLGKAGGTK